MVTVSGKVRSVSGNVVTMQRERSFGQLVYEFPGKPDVKPGDFVNIDLDPNGNRVVGVRKR